MSHAHGLRITIVGRRRDLIGGSRASHAHGLTPHHHTGDEEGPPQYGDAESVRVRRPRPPVMENS
jgi:hypothetical protein